MRYLLLESVLDINVICIALLTGGSTAQHETQTGEAVCTTRTHAHIYKYIYTFILLFHLILLNLLSNNYKLYKASIPDTSSLSTFNTTTCQNAPTPPHPAHNTNHSLTIHLNLTTLAHPQRLHAPSQML